MRCPSASVETPRGPWDPCAGCDDVRRLPGSEGPGSRRRRSSAPSWRGALSGQAAGGRRGGRPAPAPALADDLLAARVFLGIVGAASFGMAVVPAGRQQGLLRMLVLGLALLLLLIVVLVPLLRWRTTHYVITTHRLLFRGGAWPAKAATSGCPGSPTSPTGRGCGTGSSTPARSPSRRPGRAGDRALGDPRQRRRPAAAQPDGRGGRRPPGAAGRGHVRRVPAPAGAPHRAVRSRLGRRWGSGRRHRFAPRAPRPQARSGPFRHGAPGRFCRYPDLPSGPCACCTPPTGTSAGRCTAPTCSPSRRRCSARLARWSRRSRSTWSSSPVTSTTVRCRRPSDRRARRVLARHAQAGAAVVPRRQPRLRARGWAFAELLVGRRPARRAETAAARRAGAARRRAR